MESLDSHPNISAEKERFAALREHVERGKADQGRQLRWASEFYSAKAVAESRAIGFKTKLPDILDPLGFADLLQKRGARVIHLQRRNRIKLLVSLINGIRLDKATGEWNLYRDRDRLCPFAVDIEEFKIWLQKVESANRQLADYVETLQLQKLQVTYEEILCDPKSTLAGICQFLEVSSVDIHGQTKKNTSDDLRRVVLNFDELLEEFRGTRYEPMLKEVLTSEKADSDSYLPPCGQPPETAQGADRSAAVEPEPKRYRSP